LRVVEVVPKLEPSLLAMERILQQTISSNARVMDTINHYILHSSGKRLRPGLFLVSAGLGRADARLVPTAAAIELIHTASLVHDDIVDQAALRRGLPTLNARWGSEISVLAGDYLFARAFILLTRFGCREIIGLLADIIESMSTGEIEQLTDLYNPRLSEAEYLDRIRKKTASFLAGACQAGGVVRGASESELEARHAFGMNMGVAFQIKDDILDFQGQAAVTGKPVGSDLRQGIVTLPVIHLLGSGSGREALGRQIRPGELTEERLAGLLKELQRAGSLAYCQGLVDTYTGKAREALETLGDEEIREHLARILKANSHREF
jgi:heptaprenyl diphosphate synthase